MPEAGRSERGAAGRPAGVPERSATRIALRTALIYALVGAAWILLSDRLVVFEVAPDRVTLFQTIKGLFFVAVTAGLLFLLVRSSVRSLSSAEAEARFIFEQATDGIFVAEADGRFVAVNARATALTGYTAAELLTMRIADTVDAEHLKQRPWRFDELARGAEVQHERVLRRKDGSRLIVEVSAKQRPDGRIQAIVRDISERRRMEEALREREHLFAAVFEHSMDGLFVLDDEGRFVDANAATLEILGLDKTQVIGHRFSDFVPSDLATVAERGWEVIRGSGELAGESVAQRTDGRRVHVAFSVRHAILPGRHLAIVRDVEATRALEEQLRHAQRMESLGRLAGGVAHDFNNILTAILGHAEMLVDELPPDSTLRMDLEEIRVAALRASALTRQLLAFSRRQVLSPRVVDLAEVVRGIEPMLRRVIGEDVTLAFAASPGLTVRLDAGQIEQVVVNLAVNARDAMPGGGVLTVRLDREEVVVATDSGLDALAPGHYAVLSVSDTGQGMTPDVLEHIFEPFYTTKERGKGSGLGLSTVYGIVNQSGGVIRVGSQPGVGSTFRIYLPLVSGAVEAEPTAPRRRASGGSETILLVEDEESVRALARRALEAHGYRVLSAAAGPAALELSRTHQGPLHALVTDVVMPGMSGPQLAEVLRRERPEVKVLFVSGYTEDALGQRGLAAHEATFLAKPFTADLLASRVREVLDAAPLTEVRAPR